MNEKQEQTAEQRLAEAEAHLTAMEEKRDDAQAALDEAEEQVEHAEAGRDDIREEIDGPIRVVREAEARAFAAARIGPPRTVDGRDVRTACALREIPEWYIGMHYTKAIAGVAHSDRTFVTNQYSCIAVESAEGLTMLAPGSDKAFGKRGDRLTRRDMPIYEEAGPWARELGTQLVDLRLTSLVEDIFPCVEWWGTGVELDPIHGVVTGVLVAIVMPLRRSSIVHASPLDETEAG